jgi:hypothetical protein
MTRMPFGRFRGMPITDLPSWYLRWLDNLPDLRDPLASAVQLEVERRTAEEAEPEPEPEPTYRSGDVCPDPKLADELVAAGVRSLAKKYHPDVGGSNERMRDVNLTAEWLRKQSKGIAC